MRVIDSLTEFREVYSQCVATIGKYDGMHRGHQRVLQRVLDEARALSLPSVVILSEPQPEEFFRKEDAPVRLSHFWDKVDFLRRFGIDAVYRLHFDETLSQLEPEHFITDVLLAGLGVKSLVVGHDFRFGRERRGDLTLLRDYGARHGFTVSAEEAHSQEGEIISSTLVRQSLQEADFARARRLLGRDYSITGEVIKGRQLGRQLGVPTANVRLYAPSLPFTGVYAVEALFREQRFQGVASMGYNPTVNRQRQASLEVHLFDFDGDLYGATLQVTFLKKLRDERKFEDLEELKRHMLRDIEEARDFFRTRETEVSPS